MIQNICKYNITHKHKYRHAYMHIHICVCVKTTNEKLGDGIEREYGGEERRVWIKRKEKSIR